MAAFVSAAKGLALVRAGIEITEARTTLLIGFAAIRRMLRGLEATAKIAFVLVEVSALRLVPRTVVNNQVFAGKGG